MRAGVPERPEDVTIGVFAFRQGGERGKGSEFGRSRGRLCPEPAERVGAGRFPLFFGTVWHEGDWQ